MNFPTKLTVLRICLIPAFVATFFVEFANNRFVALAIFCVACFTDFLDGYIARKYNMVTTLGKFLDPIADKMLVSCALIAVITDSFFAPWVQICVSIFAMVIMCRELMVSCFRIIASGKNIVIAADIWGKIKTNVQMIALILLIPFGSLVTISADWVTIYYFIGFGLLGLATLLTIISGFNYIVKNKQVLNDKPQEER